VCGFGFHLALPWQRTGLSAGLGVGIYLVTAAAGVTGLGAMLSIATSSRLIRWLPTRPRRAPAAVAVAGYAAVGADGLGLVLLAAEVATVLGKLSLLPAAAAAGGLARMLLAKRAARHCLDLRASLT
jgi:hypothetical protein